MRQFGWHRRVQAARCALVDVGSSGVGRTVGDVLMKSVAHSDLAKKAANASIELYRCTCMQ